MNIKSFFRSYFLLILAAICLNPAAAIAGITVHGLSGTLLVPGLDILPQGGARAGMHLVGDKENREGSFKGVFAYSDDTEVGIMKRFVSGNGKEQFEPIFSAKYKVRKNVAFAALIDPTEEYKDAIMLLSGIPGNRVILGIGANLSMGADDKWGHFGRYQNDEGEVSPLFFLLGANVFIDPETEVTFDYTGNDLVLGLRHNLNERIGVDFGYYTPNRINQESRYAFGCNFGF